MDSPFFFGFLTCWAFAGAMYFFTELFNEKEDNLPDHFFQGVGMLILCIILWPLVQGARAQRSHR